MSTETQTVEAPQSLPEKWLAEYEKWSEKGAALFPVCIELTEDEAQELCSFLRSKFDLTPSLRFVAEKVDNARNLALAIDRAREEIEWAKTLTKRAEAQFAALRDKLP